MALPIGSTGTNRSPQVRSRPESNTTRRPELTLVPRRRRAAGFAVALSFLVGGVLLGVAVLHTTIAERQLRIDQLDRSFLQAQDDYDVLRSDRAVLRSPTRLAEQASAQGMRPGNASAFVPIDPGALAMVIAASGSMDTELRVIATVEPIDQFRTAKSVSSREP